MKRSTWAMTAIARARHVKALSVEQIKEYLAGADMGYSKPAEIYDFPSPAHVLKFAEGMGLSVEQRAATQALLDRHKAQALASAVRRLARVESEYRLLHLETNRRRRGLLTEEQINRYAELRGRSRAELINP